MSSITLERPVTHHEQIERDNGVSPAKAPYLDTSWEHRAAQAVLPFQRIVLTGFMGAGKSTLGRLLAQELGWRFVDVDSAIEAKAGMTVAEVFDKYGEFVFRRMETSAVAHALGERLSVIALGGGAPEVLANRLLLEQTPNTAVVFLEAPLPLLIARCASQSNAAIRPNLLDAGVAEERFRYRAPLYRRCAKYRIETGEQAPKETMAELLKLLDR